jgi:hypothetical protein
MGFLAGIAMFSLNTGQGRVHLFNAVARPLPAPFLFIRIRITREGAYVGDGACSKCLFPGKIGIEIVCLLPLESKLCWLPAQLSNSTCVGCPQNPEASFAFRGTKRR